MLNTFADLVDHVAVYSGRDNTPATSEAARRAAQQAVLILGSAHDWNWFRTSISIPISPLYQTGTITYVASTGVVTLAGGTWPTWAVYGSLRINQTDYEVQTRTSATSITLATNSRPADNIATATAYSIRRYAYQLPDNFTAAAQAMVQPQNLPLRYNPQLQSALIQVFDAAIPSYAIASDRQSTGRLVLLLAASTNLTGSIQLLYQRRLAPMRYDRYQDGLVSVTGTAVAAVAGSPTVFRAEMAGQIFRASYDETAAPTGLFGNNPFAVESQILTYNTAESLTLSVSQSLALTRSKYNISSLLDCADGPMWDYLLREAERQFRTVTRMAASREEMGMREQALVRAKEDDSRYTGTTVVSYAGNYLVQSDVPLR